MSIVLYRKPPSLPQRPRPAHVRVKSKVRARKVLAFDRPRPEPIDTRVVYAPNGTQTAIYRAWAPGDAANCRRCRECFVRRDACLLMIPWYVPRSLARGFSLADLGMDAMPS